MTEAGVSSGDWRVAAAAGFVGGSLEIAAGIGTIVIDPFTTGENIATGMSQTYTTYSAKGGPLLGVMAIVNLHRAYEVSTGVDILDGHKLSGDEIFDRSIEAAGAIGDLVLMGRGAALKYSGKAASAAGKTTATAAKSTLDDAARHVDNAPQPGVATAPFRSDPRLPILDQIHCFAPDTLVATAAGPREIAKIVIGDLVWAHDFKSGEWVQRRVLECHHNVYEGPVVTLQTDGGLVRTTVYHPFWVTAGRDLEDRPAPRELAQHEGEGLSLPGRWVNSHELRVGDMVQGRDGSRRTVLRIEQEYHSAFPVVNLTIEVNHSFAVGPDAILVHNTSDCGGVPNTPRTVATPAGRILTRHAAEDSLIRHGFRAPFNEVDDIISQAQWTVRQADSALVHIHKVAGRGRKYRLVVEGAEGIVTALKNLTPHELRNLARNNGFELPW